MLALLSAVALAAALFLPRLLQTDAPWRGLERWELALRRRGPIVVAVISIVVVWFTWDAWKPLPKVHDENSYVLQADIFASGRWTVPSPPIPDFFEQPHVQVVPAVASKYPPGNALLLSIGALIGFQALVPLALTGITAALLFVLTMRVTNPWIALLSWLLWITAPIVLRFQPSYFSELTTTPLVLASWWLLLEWRETRQPRWLWLMALAIGWGAITRQLTMLAFAIPIGVVVLRDIVRLRLWRDFGVAFAVGLAVLAILPLWHAKTTGDWRVSPVVQYRQDYMPFDKLGFTADTTSPRRTVSPVLRTTYDYFLSARKQQTLAELPRTAWDRAVNVVITLFQEARLPLLPFAIIGLFLAGRPLRFAALSSLVLFVAHLPYPHWAPWTIYYLEAAPVVTALTALGVWGAARYLSDERAARVRLAWAVVAVAVFGIPNIWKWKLDHRKRAAFDRHFASQIALIPTKPAIVFVRYTPRVAQHIAVVFNYADLEGAPVWVVHDLGPRNADLRKLAPGRASFDFDEDELVAGLRRP